MHKLMTDTSQTSADADRYITLSEKLIEKYPNNSFLATNLICLYTSAYRHMYRCKVGSDIVIKLYTLYLRFPDDDNVQEAFFELFLESDELCRWRKYYEKKSVLTYLIGSGKFHYITELRRAASDYVRKNVKVNDPCPCGSGKKYKKCCKLTGAFELDDDFL